MHISEYIKETNCSIKELAARVPCDYTLIWYFAKRKRRPSPRMALAIERATGGMVSRCEAIFGSLPESTPCPMPHDK